MPEEKAKWRDNWKIRKYASREEYEQGKAYEEAEVQEGNILLNSGINEIWDLVAGESANVFDSSNAQIGVGDGDADAEATQTDLQGENTDYQGVDSGYPNSGSDQKIVFQSVFGEDDANFDWREFVVKNSASDICLNRLQSDQGSKASGQVWTVSLEISLS